MPALGSLRRGGVRLGLVSNCSRLTRALLPTWPFGTSFDAIVLSCEVGTVKPDPAIVLAAVDALGASPEDGIFVDDSAEYVDAARMLGMGGLTMRRASERAATALA
jgi:HAD superfamily hydrolase (TIGR01509 family)